MVYVFRLIRVRSVEKFSGGKGRLLDIGFSRPMDLEMFEKRGWTAYGTQVAPQVVRVARKKHLKAFLGELSEIPLDHHAFDTVTLWHVLEHLHRPQDYLKTIRGLVKKGGKLIIEVPNFASPAAKIFKCHWFELDVPHHLFQFTPDSLGRLLAKNGFKIEKSDYFSLEQSTYSLIQSLLNLLSGKHNLLFERLKKEGEPTPLLDSVLHGFAAVVLLPFALVVSLFLGLLNQGDVVRVYCVKV
jgi:SAM-dependent methyltransferase